MNNIHIGVVVLGEVNSNFIGVDPGVDEINGIFDEVGGTVVVTISTGVDVNFPGIDTGVDEINDVVDLVVDEYSSGVVDVEGGTVVVTIWVVFCSTQPWTLIITFVSLLSFSFSVIIITIVLTGTPSPGYLFTLICPFSVILASVLNTSSLSVK